MGRTSAVVVSLSFVAYLGVWFCTIPCLHSSLLCSCASFFISLVAEELSTSLKVILIGSCSVNICNVGVSLGEGDLGVFPLLYLAIPWYSSLIVQFYYLLNNQLIYLFNVFKNQLLVFSSCFLFH